MLKSLFEYIDGQLREETEIEEKAMYEVYVEFQTGKMADALQEE